MAQREIREISPGAAKANPFTICIVANPAVKTSDDPPAFEPDPVIESTFLLEESATYICDALFGRLPGQQETWMSDPEIEPEVRVVSIYDPAPPSPETALIALLAKSAAMEPRRAVIGAYVRARDVAADVVFVVSKNPTHWRASSYAADDDIDRKGPKFTLDGESHTHCYWTTIPGTVAIHTGADSLTALHEFYHAMGSFHNGQIGDLYIDGEARVNCKRVLEPPFPPVFGEYAGTHYASDLRRETLGYPTGWKSYQCEKHDPVRTSLMDKYRSDPDPNTAQADKITRAFVQDRLRAKLNRP